MALECKRFYKLEIDCDEEDALVVNGSISCKKIICKEQKKQQVCSCFKEKEKGKEKEIIPQVVIVDSSIHIELTSSICFLYHHGKSESIITLSKKHYQKEACSTVKMILMNHSAFPIKILLGNQYVLLKYTGDYCELLFYEDSIIHLKKRKVLFVQ